MQREAKKSKRTLSAAVTEALARELRRRRLSELIASYGAEKGVITAKELAAIQGAMARVTLDSGALIGFERQDRRTLSYQAGAPART
jgi:hypothetical protein